MMVYDNPIRASITRGDVLYWSALLLLEHDRYGTIAADELVELYPNAITNMMLVDNAVQAITEP